MCARLFLFFVCAIFRHLPTHGKSNNKKTGYFVAVIGLVFSSSYGFVHSIAKLKENRFRWILIRLSVHRHTHTICGSVAVAVVDDEMAK